MSNYCENCRQLVEEIERLKELVGGALSIVMFPYREPLDEYSDEEQSEIVQKWLMKARASISGTAAESPGQ